MHTQRNACSVPNARRQRARLSATQAACRLFPGVLAVLTLAALPSVTLAETAQDDDPFDRPGFYLGLGGSYQYNVFQDRIEDVVRDALEDEGSLPPGTVVDIDIDDSGGINALVGYRVASFFALELDYEWVDEYDISGSTNTPGVSGRLYSIEGHTLTLNTRWIIPFWRIQPYLLIGGGISIADVNRGNVFDEPTLGPILDSAGIDPKSGRSTSPAGRAGLGVDLYITQHILLNAEASAVLTTLKKPDVDDIDDLNYMSFAVGLQYRF